MDEKDALKLFEEQKIDVQEAMRYLKIFRSVPAEKFAVIKIGGNCLIKEELKKELASDVAYLYALGLYPVIIHGGGKQIDRELTDNSIAIEKIDGLRKTDEKTLEIVTEKLNEITKELVELMGEKNCSAASLNKEKIFLAKPHKIKELELVGEIEAVNLEPIKIAIQDKKVPVTWCIGHDGNQVYNVNADVAANALVKAVRPRKFIFLSEIGGVFDRNGNLIPKMNLEDIDEAIEKDVVKHGMKVKLVEIRKLLLEMPGGFAVQINSPQNLLKELFTKEGAGTYISL